MRTTAAILLLAAAPALFAVTTYEARSAQHVVTVDVDGDARVYTMRVTDSATGALLASERLTPATRQAKVEVDGRTIRLAVHDTGGSLSISLLVQRDDTTVDSIQASFLTRSVTGLPPIPPPPPPPPLAMEGVHRVGGDVKAPVVITRVEPIYPDDARRARVTGIVILEAIIDEEGNVANARVLKPLPFGLDQAALDAVRQWRFRPGTLDGKPVKVLFNLTINFRLPEIEGQ